MIKIDNVTKVYGNKEALNHISCIFEQGKIHGLIGENGAGKSTLIKCILRMEKYIGTISIDGYFSFGYLPDSLYFYPYMTGREYIEFCLSAKKQKIDENEILLQNKVFRLPLNALCTSYALGMKKKLALLCLVLQKCSVYILDEPCNGLDLTGVIFFKKWCQQQRKKGTTIIISSHLISSLSEICDDILYMHEGQIIKKYQKQEFGMIEADIVEVSNNLQTDAFSNIDLTIT